MSSWSLTLLLVGAAVLLAPAGCASSTTPGAPASTATSEGIESAAATPASPTPVPSTPGATQVGATQCRDDGSYRARLVETDAATGEVLTEYRYEVGEEHLRTEQAGEESGIVVLQDTDAWQFDSTDWQRLPVVPVRPLRTPWVNNFVTGPAVARAATESTPGSLYGFDVQQVELTYDQFSDAFPQKVRDSDYVADGSSFMYWLDSCDQIVRAEVTTTFGSETAELMGPDFPLVLNYLYESYDIGAKLAAPRPGGQITPISAPPGS